MSVAGGLRGGRDGWEGEGKGVEGIVLMEGGR